MDELRRDATDTGGDLAVQRVHCDGELLLDAGPCGCGDTPAGCWLIVLACNCDDLNQSRMIDATDPAVIDAWPYADRRAGVVVSIGGVCYRFIAAMRAPGDLFPVLDFAGYDGVTYASCDVSPCADQPSCGCGGMDVSITDGITIFISYDCTETVEVCGVARIEASTQRTASRVTEVFDPQYADQAADARVEVSASGVVEGQTGGGGVVTISGTGRAYGSRASDGQSWDVTQSYDGADAGERTAFYNDSVFTSIGPYARLLRDLEPGDGFAQTRVGATQTFEASRAACCCSDSVDGDGFGDTNWSSSASLSLLRSSASFTYTQDSAPAGDGSVAYSETLTVEVSGSRRITLTGGAVIEDDDCDNPANGDGGGGGGGGQGGGGSDVGGPLPGDGLNRDPNNEDLVRDNLRKQRGCVGCGG